MIEHIRVLCHSCIKFEMGDIIYFDPYGIEEEYHDADFIFITHSHYDHFSPEDIAKIKKANTKIVITTDSYPNVLKLDFAPYNIMEVEPGNKYQIPNTQIVFETIPAYNIEKPFHPKENDWVGYVLHLHGKRYYIAGDTDVTPESLQVQCDVAFVPVGGQYTMDSKQAAELVNTIFPKAAVPTHYGAIVGTPQDAAQFRLCVNKDIAVMGDGSF